MSCVTTTLVIGLLRRVPRINSLITSLMIGSSPVVGSSYSMTSGSEREAPCQADPLAHARPTTRPAS